MKTIRITSVFVFHLLFLQATHANEKFKTDTFSFISEGKRLYGLLNIPIHKKIDGIVLLVQGYGKSNVIAGNWFGGLRSLFASEGLASFVWDKPGCGLSEGTFDINQTVQSSADEVIAAIKELKKEKIPGAENIGLWGISRAGWICPIVIQKYKSIGFWISVSGTDDKENFGYFLESNFRIEGRSEAQTQLLISEWQKGNEIFKNGGTFEDYQRSTQNLRKDTFWLAVSGDPYTEEGFTRQQKKFITENHSFDKETGLMIYVPNFREMLSRINCPVLAVFGEKDANVNWRKTMQLYKETIGTHNSNLTIKTLPNCNHNIIKCKTGGFREHVDWQPCDGYFDTISNWIRENKSPFSRR